MSAHEKTRRVLGIVGSPRQGGNTDILVEQVLAGAREAGAVADKVALSRLDIKACRGCDFCQRAGRCVHHDDMAALQDRMRNSDVWVLGTPVYWWGPTSLFKAFVDRWYFARYAVPFEGRRIIVAIPLEDTDPAAARHTVGMLTDALNWLKAEICRTIVAPGVRGPGAVKEHAGLLEEARCAGRRAVLCEAQDAETVSLSAAGLSDGRLTG